jgi:hypothetical protein
VATPVGSHVGQPHGLVVKHQVRDLPRYAVGRIPRLSDR